MFLNKLGTKLFCGVLRARWVVSGGEDPGDLGLRIAGVTLWYYKWPDPMIAVGREPRVMRKKEFGIVIKNDGDARYHDEPDTLVKAI